MLPADLPMIDALLNAPHSTAADGGHSDERRWHELIAEIGMEVAEPLTSALERIQLLTTTGRIDRNGLRALRKEVEQARRVAMTSQQLARFASGRLRQSHERLHLAETLNDLLAHRGRETQARGIVLRPVLKPAEVIVDPALLFSLLGTTLDWAMANAHSNIEFMIDISSGVGHARLACQFTTHSPEPGEDELPASLPHSICWRLLEQTASMMGLPLERSDVAGTSTLMIEFPRTVRADMEGLSTLEIDDGFAPSSNSKPLAGNHVLVVSGRRDMRVQIRDALRNMGLIIDFVNTVDEAAEFCRDGLPHAVVIESIQTDERYLEFRDEIMEEVPDFVFIEIAEEGSTFEMSGFSGAAHARVGRDAIAASLPSALMFELSKGV